MAEVLADVSTLDKFKNIVSDFNRRYAVLSSNTYGAKIARTNDSALMQEYGNTLARMTTVKSGIENVMSAYQGLKSFVGLGVIPLIPLAVIAGVTIAVTTALTTMNNFMKRAGVAELQEENPNLSIGQAAAIYDKQTQTEFGRALDIVQLVLFAGGAFLLWTLFGRK